MIFVAEISFAKSLLSFLALQVPRPSGITVLFGAVTGFIIVSGRMVGLIGLCNACRGVLGAGGAGWAGHGHVSLLVLQGEFLQFVVQTSRAECT